MKPQSSLFTSALAIVAIGLGIALAMQSRRIGELEAEVARLEAASTTAPTASPDLSQPEVAVAQPDDSSGEDSSPPTAPQNLPAKAPDTAEQEGRRMMQSVSKMMENPAFNEMIEAQQKATMGVLYASYIDSLDLDPEQKDYFLNLLLSRQMFRAELSMKMMGGELSQAEIKALGNEMKKYDEEIGADIKHFLNSEDDWAEWEFYEKTLQERMAISGISSALAQAEIPIGPAEERRLIEVMAEEKEQYSFTSNLTDQENYDLSSERFSEENVAALAEDLEGLDASILQRATEILSAEQLAVFEKSQQQAREMQLSQIRMAAQMFSRE